MESLQKYEITITVSPLHMVHGVRYTKLTPTKQWDFILFNVHCALQKYKVEYSLYPEFHAAKNNFNIHVHGILFSETPLNKLDEVDIYKRFNNMGRSNFKSINNIVSWSDYIIKDQEKFDNLHYATPGYNDMLKGAISMIRTKDLPPPNIPRFVCVGRVVDLLPSNEIFKENNK